MRIIFLTIGLVLLAISLVKILSPPLAHTFEIIGYQFNDPTFSATANSTLTKAEQISKELINSYEKWNTTSFYLGWTGLFFTSLATLIAGLHRKKSNSNGTEFLNTKLTSIGLLCALASIINLAHDRISDIASNKKMMREQSLLSLPKQRLS